MTSIMTFYMCILDTGMQQNSYIQLINCINPLPDMPILGSSSSAANKDMMAKIWTEWDTIICLSRKHCGKWRYCSS